MLVEWTHSGHRTVGIITEPLKVSMAVALQQKISYNLNKGI
jgi:hypothetical protein